VAPGTAEVQALIAAQAGVDAPTWVSQIDAAAAAVEAIQAMQNNATANPFTRLAAGISDADAKVTDIRSNLLPVLVSNVTTFNGLFYRNASFAMRGLLDQVGRARAPSHSPCICTARCGTRSRRLVRRLDLGRRAFCVQQRARNYDLNCRLSTLT
jgi:hypothetical protein